MKKDEGIVSWQDAVDAVAKAHLNLRPVYFGDGLIKCAIGYYRLAIDVKGHVALLFGFSPEHLRGKKYLFTKDKEFVSQDNPLYVVDVRQEAPPENVFNMVARPRPWVEPLITEHQEALRTLFLNHATLFETEAGRTWQSSSVAYKLFPDENNPANEEGTPLFKLRFYSTAAVTENCFVPVDENAEDRGLTSNMQAYALDKGSVTLDEARKFIFQDFFKRIQRTRLGLEVLSGEEIRKNPIKYFIARQAQKLNAYNKNTTGLAKAKDILKIVLFPVMALLDPKSVFEKAAGKIGEKIEKKVIDKRLRKKTLVDEFRDPPPEGMKLRDPSYARAKVGSLSAFIYMSAAEAHAAPDNANVFTDLHDDWAKEWLLSALQGRSGMMAWPRTDDVVSIQQPNGLLIYYHQQKDRSARRAFAQLRLDWRQPEAPPMPESVEKLFKGEDHIVEIDMSYGHIRTRPLTEEQFRETLVEITGNKSWERSSNDNKPQRVESPVKTPSGPN